MGNKFKGRLTLNQLFTKQVSFEENYLHQTLNLHTSVHIDLTEVIALTEHIFLTNATLLFILFLAFRFN